MDADQTPQAIRMYISVLLGVNLLAFYALGLLRPVFARKWHKWAAMGACVAVILTVGVKIPLFSRFNLYPAPLLFLLATLFLVNGKRSPRPWLVGIAAGILSWKLGDLYPLSPALPLLQSVCILLPALWLCKSNGTRLLVFAIAPLVSGPCYMVADFFLFRYLFLEIGTNGAADLQLLCLSLFAGGWLVRALLRRRFPARGQQRGDDGGKGYGHNDAYAPRESADQLAHNKVVVDDGSKGPLVDLD